MKLRTILVALCVAAAAFVVYSCGGDGSETVKKSSFDGTIGGETAQNENDQVVPNQFSAQIADKIVTIYLMPNPASVIYIVGETDDSHKLPGNLKINELTYTNGATIYTYQSGTVSLDDCPSLMGETFTGSLSNVVVADQAGGTTKTITGDFSVTVNGVANAALVCGGGDTTTDNDTTAPQCGYSAQQCEDGVCCPYVECYNACFISDCMTICTDPNQMTQCMSCMSNCSSVTCASKMTSACNTAYTALDTCMNNNGCDNLTDDVEIACARTNCCNELKAAFQK